MEIYDFIVLTYLLLRLYFYRAVRGRFHRTHTTSDFVNSKALIEIQLSDMLKDYVKLKLSAQYWKLSYRC